MKKQPLSVSYKLVFVFVVFMFLFNIMAHPKGGAFAWIWAYILWQMHKRNNVKLVTFLKSMLWFLGFLGFIGALIVGYYDESSQLIGLNVFGYLVVICLGLIEIFLLYLYFKKQLNQDGHSLFNLPLDTSINSDQSNYQAAQNENSFYEQAYKELHSDNKIIGVWAKALAEVQGNKDVAESSYLKIRAESFKSDKKIIDFVSPNAQKDHLENHTVISQKEKILPPSFGIKSENKQNQYSPTSKIVSQYTIPDMIEGKKYKVTTHQVHPKSKKWNIYNFDNGYCGVEFENGIAVYDSLSTAMRIFKLPSYQNFIWWESPNKFTESNRPQFSIYFYEINDI